MERPQLWIVAGPNGSGKSTLVSRADIRSVLRLANDLVVLNPDEINRVTRTRLLNRARLLRFVPRFGDFTNWLAVRRVEQDLAAAIEEGRSALVETVLSTRKYCKHLVRARERGFLVAMIFVALPTPQENVVRVASRHAQGGHDVPKEKIVRRWERSHTHLTIVAHQVDRLLVFNNAPVSLEGNATPQLVATKKAKNAPVQLLHATALPRVTEALAALTQPPDQADDPPAGSAQRS